MAKIRKPIPSRPEIAAEIYREAKEAHEEAAATLAAATAQFLEALAEEPGCAVELGGTTYKRVQATRTVTDYESIHLLLDEGQRKLVCVEKIDPKKFVAAVELGAIPIEIVEANTTEKKAAPYVSEGKTK